jgi:hypothetical protein
VDIERAIKLAIVAGAVLLLAADLAIGRAWSGMPETATAALLGFAVLGRADRRVVAVVLASSCLFPPLVWLTLDTFSVHFWTLWMAALLGAMSPDLTTTGWHLAPRWRMPLMLAALATILATPIVAAREIDFDPALLGDVPGAVLSGQPWHAAGWVLQVGLVTLVGILWFEWLMGTTDDELAVVCVQPFVLSVAASALLAVYQMLVDVTFLNETVYGAGGRASGALFDANLNGVLSAAGISLACFLAHRSPWRPGWLTLVPLFVVAVWASGSRTAFAAAAFALAVSGVTLWPVLRTPATYTTPTTRLEAGVRPRSMRSWALPTAAGAALVITWIAIAHTETTTSGPLPRFIAMLPSGSSGRSVSAALAELWHRNGYGTASTRIIAQFPWTGVGIGSFHLFGPQLSKVGALPSDNAQNWLRHQIAEMGLLGAVGWIMFAGALAWFLGSTCQEGERRLMHLRGMLVAFAGISLFGVPTQEVLATVTFWTAAAGVVRLPSQRAPTVPLHRRTLAAMAVVTLVFGVATWRAAHTTLRVPERARQVGWPYSYGFSDPEPDGTGGTVRWMGRRATALVDVSGPYLRLTIRSPLPNVERDPVDIDAWCDGRSVIHARVTSGDPVSTTVPIPPGSTRTMLDVRVSRTVRPRDLDGTPDDRDLGALVAWTFSARGE